MDSDRELPPPRCTVGLIAVGELFGLAFSKALSSILHCNVSTESIGVDDAEVDLAVIDLVDDEATSAEIRRFRASHPSIPILGIFTRRAAASSVAQLPRFAGVVRSAPIDEFVAAARELQPATTPREASAVDAAAGRLDSLSPRELDLLPLLAGGMTLRSAAKRLGITYKTADSYRSNLLRKLGIRDRIQLARFAIREGIIEA